MTTLEDIEEKWGRKAKAAAAQWLSELRAGAKWDNARTKLREEDFLAGIDKAIGLHKWKRKYKAAYTRKPRD